MPGFASMSILTSSTSPSVAAAALSITGASMWQGPQHSAQKSTSTGTLRERSMTACSNPASSTSIAIPRRSLGQVPRCGYHRIRMTELESYDELAVPAGAEVRGVFGNGVPLVAGQDYEVLTDR